MKYFEIVGVEFDFSPDVPAEEQVKVKDDVVGKVYEAESESDVPDKISDKTGWLVLSVDCHEVKPMAWTPQFTQEEIEALVEHFKDYFSTEGYWEAIHEEIFAGKDPEEVIEEMRKDVTFRLFWKLYDGDSDKDMEAWLSDAKKNAIELAKERWHRVVEDRTSSGLLRLTCMKPQCADNQCLPTLVRQPWMRDADWKEAVAKFNAAHPHKETE